MSAVGQMARERGSTEAPPIVLLHGAGCDARIFDELSGRLEGWEVLAIDLPGRRKSPGPPARTASEAAAFVRSLLDELSIERAMVLGHSFGGAVAMELALLAEERVSALVLVSTGARLRVHPAILSAMDLSAKAGGRSVVNLPWLPNTERALVRRVEKQIGEVPAITAAADWHAANLFDRMAEVRRVECPTLILTGTEDALTPPKYAHWLEENMPNARCVLVQGGGHMLPVEHAGEVVERVREFGEVIGRGKGE